MKKTSWEKFMQLMPVHLSKRFVKEADTAAVFTVQTLCVLLDSHDAELEALQRAYSELCDKLPEEPEEPDECDSEATDSRAALLVFVRDLAEAGTRADTTPTKHMRHGDKGWDENEEWWHAYLKRIDDGVRSRAKHLLKSIGQ